MKEMLKRTLRTFFQTAAAYIAANFVCATSGITDIGTLKTIVIGLIISSIAAGLAAIMNLPQPDSKNPDFSDTSVLGDESGKDKTLQEPVNTASQEEEDDER